MKKMMGLLFAIIFVFDCAAPILRILCIQAWAQEATTTPTVITAQVQGVDFKYAPEKSRLEISLDKESVFEKNISEADKQVIIEIKNTKISTKYSRKLDTSSFKSNVSLISPYQSDDNVRVVLQLKDLGDVEVTQEGSKIIALVDNKQLDQQPAKTAAESPLSEPVPPASLPTPAPEAAASLAPAPEQNTVSSPEAPKDHTSLDQFFQAQNTKQYTGKKISLQMRDAELQDVFRIISEASEFNIVLSSEVKGKLTLNLDQVPWDQALDIILHSQKLAAERNGNVLRITTMEALTKEKEAELAAQKASEAVEPLVVKIFPVSYARIEDLKKILEDFLSRETSFASLGGVTSSSARRGSIQVDDRINALVVRDTPSTIEKIKRILKELDTQTPQILIEAKFVEVQERRQRDIQGRIFSTSREFDAAGNQFIFRGTRNNFGALFGGTGFAANGLAANFAISPIQGGSIGFAPRANLIPGIGEIAAFLSILEQESSAKIIASPRIVTQNKEAAEISQGQTIQLPTTAGANSAGSFVTVSAILKLKVTPQVTNDGSINLKITFSQEAPSAQQLGGTGSFTTDSKQVQTAVLVDSGATLVIGGIYTSTTRTAEAGIPLLRNIPILGLFFGSKATQVEKGELFIFLTPRVLNEKEAGIRG